jgi:hypothetical protein
MTRHYGAVVSPARAYKPKDKAKAEVGASRRELCERLDKPQLLPLGSRFQDAEWTRCTVHIDYHLDLDRHFYSVPTSCAGTGSAWKPARRRSRSKSSTTPVVHENIRGGGYFN